MTFVFNPVRDLIRTADLAKNFDTVFYGSRKELSERTWTPAVELAETENSFTLELDIPGVKKEEIKISVENNTLTVSGVRKDKHDSKSVSYRHNERAYGGFRRSFTLSRLVDSTKIDASFENGVLTLTLPKAEEAKPREVEIRIA